MERKPKFCPFREKPCRTDCMHYEESFSGGRACKRDNASMIAENLPEAPADSSCEIQAIANALALLAARIQPTKPGDAEDVKA